MKTLIPLITISLYLTFYIDDTGAHHGFGGKYDRSKPIYLEGKVINAYFGYPHAEIQINIDTANKTRNRLQDAEEFLPDLIDWHNGLDLNLEIEFPPVQRFFALDGQVKTGHRVAVIVLRNCEPPHQLRGQWITLANGTTVVRSGQMQREVNGC